MRTIDDGGAAFPQFDVIAGDRDGHGDIIEAYTVARGGMSLRDWFAGQAMAAMLTGVVGRIGAASTTAYAGGPCNAVIVDRAYAVADAMLAERNKDRPAR